jgi:hypothetical protein
MNKSNGKERPCPQKKRCQEKCNPKQGADHITKEKTKKKKALQKKGLQ